MARGLAAALLVLPAGDLFGVVDAYRAHCISSDNTPEAYLCSPFHSARHVPPLSQAAFVPV